MTLNYFTDLASIGESIVQTLRIGPEGTVRIAILVIDSRESGVRYDWQNALSRSNGYLQESCGVILWYA